jgi:hypothetical protein
MLSPVVKRLTSWRFPAALLLLVFSLHGGSILLSRPRAQSLSPGIDYVQGELIVTFAEHFMPSQDQVSLASQTFGIPSLDSLLSVHECYDVYKFLGTYGRAKSEGGKWLERTFLFKFRDGTDAQVLQAALLRLPLFECVSLNRLLEIEYGAVEQRFPTGSDFDDQWYFHDEANDSADIDAPEAWAITGGSPDVVICIHDNGAMVDTSTSPWRLHSDFNFYWTAEDVGTPHALSAEDLDFTDSPEDPDTLKDNVIGYNWAEPPRALSDLYKLHFWQSVPHDWNRCPDKGSTTCARMDPHGT